MYRVSTEHDLEIVKPSDSRDSREYSNRGGTPRISIMTHRRSPHSSRQPDFRSGTVTKTAERRNLSGAASARIGLLEWFTKPYSLLEFSVLLVANFGVRVQSNDFVVRPLQRNQTGPRD